MISDKFLELTERKHHKGTVWVLMASRSWALSGLHRWFSNEYGGYGQSSGYITSSMQRFTDYDTYVLPRITETTELGQWLSLHSPLWHFGISFVWIEKERLAFHLLNQFTANCKQILDIQVLLCIHTCKLSHLRKERGDHVWQQVSPGTLCPCSSSQHTPLCAVR